MSSCNNLLCEEQLQCSICLEVFTEPVTIACGHNFCKACITGYRDNSDHCQCPLCKEIFTKRPELKTNTTIWEVSDHFKGVKERSISDKSAKQNRDEACDICTLRKMKSAKFCIESLPPFCEFHLEPHHRIPGLKRHTFLDNEVKLDDNMCKKHHVLLDMFCRMDKESVCRLCVSEDHETHIMVPLKVESDDMKVMLEETELRLSKRDAQKDTLNTVQAFSALVASIEGSQSELVWLIKKKQRVHGFTGSSVAAKEGFSSGRFYFEVQVEGKEKWAVGVVKESADRKKWFSVSPEHGYWTIELGGGYKANMSPPVFLYPRKLKKVGVFVDYEDGEVSFYDTQGKCHIYSFTGYTFTEKLYPSLQCGIDDSVPLV
uniref:Uncharacterized protein n=1 Tax=Acanthochromis polyacanthus TaxID=80966 RepID=A0A3Q1E9F2_9TELE